MIDQNGFILENQLELPFFALSINEMRDAAELCAAWEAGYRHFLFAEEHTARISRLLQDAALPRQALYLTMVLAPQAALAQKAEELLSALQLPFLDLLLLRHAPGDRTGDWAEMEWLLESGAARGIGVSGFRPQALLPLLRTAKTAPMANLLPFSLEKQPAVTAQFCLSRGIQLIGAIPRELPPSPFAKSYDKSPLQLCTRLALQDNILPLLPSRDAIELRAAREVFDFELTPEDFYAMLTEGE